jgi:hypothetical protein
MNHIYRRDELQQRLNLLVGDSIKNVFYHLTYEGYKSFLQLQDEAQQTLLVGLLLEMVSGKVYGIHGLNYSYNGDYQHTLEGIHVEQIKEDLNIDSLTISNHIFDKPWKGYREKRIKEISIYEITTKEEFVDRKTFKLIEKEGNTFKTPSGIKLEFEDQNTLYMFNMEISSYSEENDTYNFVWGTEEVTIVFGNKAFRKHLIPEDVSHVLQIFV